MYPAYPLLCVMGAHAVDCVLGLLNSIESMLFPRTNEKAHKSISRNRLGYLASLVFIGLSGASIGLGASRITSNYRNYHGNWVLLTLTVSS
jgi:hypothetical protein